MAPSAIYLYNTPAHLLGQSKKGWRVFEFAESATGTVCVRMAVCIRDGVAMNPVKAPFGSCEIYKKISAPVLHDFFMRMEEVLRLENVTDLVIRNYPELYDAKKSRMMHAVLGKMQFRVLHEVSSVLLVNQVSFSRKIKPSERQKRGRSEKLFSFEQRGDKDVSRIYSFINACRKERNQTLSMSLAEMRKTVAAFPDKFLFFQVADDRELAAAAIVVRVSNDVLYTFYYAHARKFDRVSPVVQLLSGVYAYAQIQGIKLVDLGTSMLDGKVNRSLLHFKESLGAVTNRKFTFSKTYR